jgi:hypothetical protein
MLLVYTQTSACPQTMDNVGCVWPRVSRPPLHCMVGTACLLLRNNTEKQNAMHCLCCCSGRRATQALSLLPTAPHTLVWPPPYPCCQWVNIKPCLALLIQCPRTLD